MRRITGVLIATFMVVALQPAAAHAGTDICASAVDLERNLAQDPLPVAALTPCPGIRPGAGAVIESTTGCTLNFVFRGATTASDGTVKDEGLFIGIAGHCLFPDESPPVTWAAGEGPEVADSAGTRIGNAIFGVDEGNHDFGLIAIDDAREAAVNPALCHFGGPTGSTQVDIGDVVHHFGQGLVVGDTVPGRSGVVGPLESPDGIIYTGNAIFGDSGSPLIAAGGAAAGVVVAILPPLVFATDLSVGVRIAQETTGIDFALQTAPFAQ